MLTISGDKDLQADRARYPRRPGLREQSWYAVRVYRFGRSVDRLVPGARRRILTRAYWFLFRVVETVTGISLPKEAIVGPGLRIHHFGGVVVHPAARLGGQVTLRQGVTIGERREGGGVPVLCDGVDVGAHAHLLGPIVVGRGARVGAMALVIEDVPPGGVVLAPLATLRPAVAAEEGERS